MEHPFVYISALMRTGSTALSEALTRLPQTFIFHETHLGKNTFSLSEPDQANLKACGIDIEAFLRMRLVVAFVLRRLHSIWPRQDYMIMVIKRNLIPKLCAMGLQQLGVKEIKHEGWEHYVRHFPCLKMVMLGRDPRDLYISAFRKWQAGTTLWRGNFTPETVASELNAQFARQQDMCARVDCLKLRYEDLCTDPRAIRHVMKFTDSPLTGIGEVGQFLSSHPKRRHEYALHGHTLSQRSVSRWQRENDQALLADAIDFASRMSAYNENWDYTLS